MRRPLRVMIVDDDVGVLATLKTILEPLNFDVVALADSRKAAQLIASVRFDGIFVDARMPSPDGFELTRRIRASGPNAQAPVVMLTGYDDADTLRAGFKSGITFFLAKSVTAEQIMSLCTSMRGLMLKERRAHSRLPLRTSVHCTWGIYNEREFDADSLNISAGGLLLESAASIAVGERVSVEFMLTFNRPIKAGAVVVRVEPPDRIALQFADLQPEQVEVIRYFIESGIKPPR